MQKSYTSNYSLVFICINCDTTANKLLNQLEFLTRTNFIINYWNAQFQISKRSFMQIKVRNLTTTSLQQRIID